MIGGRNNLEFGCKYSYLHFDRFEHSHSPVVVVRPVDSNKRIGMACIFALVYFMHVIIKTSSVVQ